MLREPYISWKDELKIWQNFTDIDAKKQGGAVFLSLPNPSSARDAVLELGPTVINGDDAVTKIIEKLDTLFLKDSNIATYQAWQKFIKFVRPPDMNMSDYTIEFNRLYNFCEKNQLVQPTGVLAIQFLESANLPPEQHRLALATCGSMTYETMKSQVLKISTDIANPSVSKALQEPSKLLQSHEIKIESPTLQATGYDNQLYYEDYADDEDQEEEEGEATDTFYGHSSYNNYSNNTYANKRPYNAYGQSSRARRPSRANYGNYRGFRPQGNSQPQNWRSNSYRGSSSATKPPQRRPTPNPPDKYGRPRQCRECLSIYHLEDRCPELESNIVLFTDEVSPASTLLEETLGCMVVDSGCIHTVSGKIWLESYIDSLSCKDRKSITYEESNFSFKFGNGASFKSLKKVTVPVYLGKMRIRVTTDVVDCEIPMLFSKNSLKKGNGTIDFAHDTIRILKQSLSLENTSTGHYIHRISRDINSPIEDVKDVLFSVNVEDMDESNLSKTASKWHKQFAHPPAHKLINLLSRANIESDKLNEAIR